jgi:hypothetical protein
MKSALAAVAALAALFAIGCGPAAPPPDKPVMRAESADNCTTTDDCDLVDACCGCTAGGRKIAIRKDAVAGFESTREQRCGGQTCAQMMSTDPSCDAETICGSGNRCRVAPHMQHQ